MKEGYEGIIISAGMLATALACIAVLRYVL
jgi:hypothetical protein